jgi:hypothetical protein
MSEDYIKCLDCGLIENSTWAEKHQCGKITDPKFRIFQDLTLKIGKKKFVKIICNT